MLKFWTEQDNHDNWDNWDNWHEVNQRNICPIIFKSRLLFLTRRHFGSFLLYTNRKYTAPLPSHRSEKRAILVEC